MAEIVRGKALALVMETADVTDTDGAPVDLYDLRDDASAPVESALDMDEHDHDDHEATTTATRVTTTESVRPAGTASSATAPLVAAPAGRTAATPCQPCGRARLVPTANSAPRPPHERRHLRVRVLP